eukprot:1626119-Rhodomonas_salina.1
MALATRLCALSSGPGSRVQGLGSRVEGLSTALCARYGMSGVGLAYRARVWCWRMGGAGSDGGVWEGQGREASRHV